MRRRISWLCDVLSVDGGRSVAFEGFAQQEESGPISREYYCCVYCILCRCIEFNIQ